MHSERLKSQLGEFAKKRLLVIGDVMLDRFIWGNVSRISPEAPIPVVEVTREDHYPGGAANVARNLLPFAGKVSVMGLAGNDPEGMHLCDILEGLGIDAEPMIQDPGRETTLKTRVVARSQQVVRIDREKRCPLDESQLKTVIARLEKALVDTDAVILQDYGKGFVTQPLVDRVAELAREAQINVFVDPNPGNPLAWKGATAIKPNRHEALKLAGLPDQRLSEPIADDPALLKAAATLFDAWETEILLVTLGSQGMALCERGKKPVHIPPRAREVFDVSGAGDTAIALLSLGMTAGLTPLEAAELANYASAVVVGKVGTATLTADELLTAVSNGAA